MAGYWLQIKLYGLMSTGKSTQVMVIEKIGSYSQRAENFQKVRYDVQHFRNMSQKIVLKMLILWQK
ncbi:MAG: hypothetical protein DYG98_15930 [Haliscomenobacteraceae bacterium CHB4]|nr:hypothetical protein [Haliscomenobacteraceae bacterium CHB4]